MQVTTYAMLTTRPHCLLLYVNRDTGDRFVVEWDTYEHAPDVEQWLTEAAAHPEVVDRDERGPGMSFLCDRCPFVGPCWNYEPDTEPTIAPQSVVAGEIGIAMALANYVAARDTADKAGADKAFWRATLDGSPAGDYDGWRLKWKGTGDDTPILDGKAAQAALEEAGIEVPMKMRKGSRSIDVAPTPKDPED